MNVAANALGLGKPTPFGLKAMKSSIPSIPTREPPPMPCVYFLSSRWIGIVANRDYRSAPIGSLDPAAISSHDLDCDGSYASWGLCSQNLGADVHIPSPTLILWLQNEHPMRDH